LVGVQDGATPLYIAAQEGHLEVVKALMAHPELDFDVAEEGGATPLYIAAQEGHWEIVRQLMTGPNLDHNDKLDINKAMDVRISLCLCKFTNLMSFNSPLCV
jgi:ankyrin repeat protein